MESRRLGPDEYPAELKEIPEPPRSLFARGSWAPEGTKYLAVVGSRALSSYGREACEKIIAGLSGYPISIVSGMALGADACAHKAALRAGLHTVAVLGSGVDERSVYPRSHANLAKEILSSGGMIVSENPEGYKARPEDFPKRNRIVVGLSQAVLVVEAGPQSGTLITARLSHEYNRDLLCIPHRIGDPHGFGANLFIRLGAGLVAEPEHILEALRIEPRGSATASDLSGTLQGDEKTLYELLAEPMPKDDVIRASGLSSSAALSALVMLELKGVLKEEFGMWRRT